MPATGCITVDTDAGPIDVQVTHRKPIDVWKDKEALVGCEQKAAAVWNKLDDEERVAICVLIQNTFLRLVDHVDEWVPTSVTLNSAGDRLDVLVSVVLPSVDRTVLAERVEAERRRARQYARVMELRDELAVEDDE